MKKETAKQKKIHKVMHEFKQGTLHSGSKHGPVVKNAAQAEAIAINQAKKAYPHGSGSFSDKDIANGYRVQEVLDRPKDCDIIGPGSTVQLQESRGDSNAKSGDPIGRPEILIPGPSKQVQFL